MGVGVMGVALFEEGGVLGVLSGCSRAAAMLSKAALMLGARKEVVS